MQGRFSVQIKKLQFQRNGISGQPFYQALIGTGCNKSDLVVTFTTINEDPMFSGHDDMRVDTRSVRVTDPNHFDEAWRGDEYGDSIQDAIDELKLKYGVESVYEVMEHLGGRWKARSRKSNSREEKMF